MTLAVGSDSTLVFTSDGIQSDGSRSTVTVDFVSTVRDGSVGVNSVIDANTDGNGGLGAATSDTVLRIPTAVGTPSITLLGATGTAVPTARTISSSSATFTPLSPTALSTIEGSFSTTAIHSTSSSLPTESARTLVNNSQGAMAGGVVGGSLLVICVVAILLFIKPCTHKRRSRQGRQAIEVFLPFSMDNSSSQHAPAHVSQIVQRPSVVVTTSRSPNQKGPIVILPIPSTADRIESTTREPIVVTHNEASTTPLPLSTTSPVVEQDSHRQDADAVVDGPLQTLTVHGLLARYKGDGVQDIRMLNPQLEGSGDIMNLEMGATSDSRSTERTLQA